MSIVTASGERRSNTRVEGSLASAEESLFDKVAEVANSVRSAFSDAVERSPSPSPKSAIQTACRELVPRLKNLPNAEANVLLAQQVEGIVKKQLDIQIPQQFVELTAELQTKEQELAELSKKLQAQEKQASELAAKVEANDEKMVRLSKELVFAELRHNSVVKQNKQLQLVGTEMHRQNKKLQGITRSLEVNSELIKRALVESVFVRGGDSDEQKTFSNNPNNEQLCSQILKDLIQETEHLETARNLIEGEYNKLNEELQKEIARRNTSFTDSNDIQLQLLKSEQLVHWEKNCLAMLPDLKQISSQVVQLRRDLETFDGAGFSNAKIGAYNDLKAQFDDIKKRFLEKFESNEKFLKFLEESNVVADRPIEKADKGLLTKLETYSNEVSKENEAKLQKIYADQKEFCTKMREWTSNTFNTVKFQLKLMESPLERMCEAITYEAHYSVILENIEAQGGSAMRALSLSETEASNGQPNIESLSKKLAKIYDQYTDILKEKESLKNIGYLFKVNIMRKIKLEQDCAKNLFKDELLSFAKNAAAPEEKVSASLAEINRQVLADLHKRLSVIDSSESKLAERGPNLGYKLDKIQDAIDSKTGRSNALLGYVPYTISKKHQNMWYSQAAVSGASVEEKKVELVPAAAGATV